MTSFLRRIRLRSISTPFGGAGIEVLPDNEKRAVEQFFSFLEGRRALHVTLDSEYDGEVFAALEAIRHRTDATLAELKRGSRTYVLVERFRDACITFFDTVPPPITDPFDAISPPYREALETFRRTVGPILGHLEGATGVQVRSGLTELPRYFQPE